MKNILRPLIFLSSIISFCSSNATMAETTVPETTADIVPAEELVRYHYNKKDIGSKISDPMSYVFFPDPVTEEMKPFRYKLMNYAGFYWEGEKLKRRCMGQRDVVSYATPNELTNVKRSMIATLQYIVLDVSLKAIAQYAHFFKFSDDDFNNLVNRLVGNYCSPNLSVISLKELRNNFFVKFNKKSNGNFKLPTFEGNPLFPSVFKDYDNNLAGKEREFSTTVELFRASCSWAGDPDIPRLLAPLISDAKVMSFIIRQLNSKFLNWDFSRGEFRQEESPHSVQVYCENLVCRRTEIEKFLSSFPVAVGGKSLDDDLSRVYCQEFFINKKNIDSSDSTSMSDLSPEVQAWSRSLTEGSAILMVSQFLSLMTSVPDFILKIVDAEELKKVFRSSLDEQWTQWATEALNGHSRHIFYEESVQIEKIDSKFYFNARQLSFAVYFDISVGEWDRTFWQKGKLMIEHPLKIEERFLAMIKDEWNKYQTDKWNVQKEGVVNLFKKHLQGDLDEMRKKFIVPPWDGDLASIIARELLLQLDSYHGPKLSRTSKKELEIILRFYYGPYALKYFSYRAQLDAGNGSIPE